MTCEHSGGEFYWKSHDLSICISPNSFADVIPAKLNITAYLSISNESFCGYHIVSAVFKIDSNVENFDPPVKLRIPHCVTLESNSDCEKMHFLVQHADNYTLRKQGIFKADDFYGTVELTKFSYIAIIWEKTITYCRMVISFIIHGQEESNHQQQDEQQLQQLQQSQDSSSSESDPSSANHYSYTSKAKDSGDQYLTNLVYGEILTLPQSHCQQFDNWIGAYCIVQNVKTWLQ